MLTSKIEVVGTEWFGFDVGAWTTVSMRNDGPSDLYLRTLGKGETLSLPWEHNEAPIKSGEQLSIDMDRKPGSPLYGICRTGSATVRMFKLYNKGDC